MFLAGSKVLLANQKDVRLLPLENPNLTEIVANKLSQAAACDYIFSKSLVFWIDAADYKKVILFYLKKKFDSGCKLLFLKYLFLNKSLQLFSFCQSQTMFNVFKNLVFIAEV